MLKPNLFDAYYGTKYEGNVVCKSIGYALNGWYRCCCTKNCSLRTKDYYHSAALVPLFKKKSPFQQLIQRTQFTFYLICCLRAGIWFWPFFHSHKIEANAIVCRFLCTHPLENDSSAKWPKQFSMMPYCIECFKSFFIVTNAVAGFAKISNGFFWIK